MKSLIAFLAAATVASSAFAANTIEKLPSGVVVEHIKQGTGPQPTVNDVVRVNYRGTLANGTEFDSSAKHGGPATFPSNGVIPGWQEALALMKPGAKYQLFIPPKLAYDLESPPSIPPGSMLIFDVELVSIKPAGAAAPGGAVHPQIQPAQPSSK